MIAKTEAQDGMSLRDWFAGQALAGLNGWTKRNEDWSTEQWAERSYEYADAMLKARSPEAKSKHP